MSIRSRVMAPILVRALLAALAGLLLLPTLVAATTLTVDTRPGFRSGMRSVAVVPMDCNRKLDCSEIERRVEEALRNTTGLTVIGSDEVGGEMDPWDSGQMAPGNMAALATDVGADTILTIDLIPGGSAEGFKPRWSPLNPDALTFQKSLVGGKKDAVQIHLLSGETGEVLLEGTAVGKGLCGGNTDKTARELIALILKAFGQ